MSKVYKAALLGYGQLGKPWFDYVSRFKKWNIERFKSVEDVPVENFDVIFLAVKDTSLNALIDKLKNRKIQICHFSGFNYFEEAYGLHPVHSFSKSMQKVDFDQLRWVLDSKKVPAHIKDLLGLKLYDIEPENKKNYHTHLSVAANMTQLVSFLMGESFSKETGLPSDILKSLMTQSIENEQKFGAKSFSGPWVRNEKEAQNNFTKELNNKILSKTNKSFEDLIEVYHENY